MGNYNIISDDAIIADDVIIGDFVKIGSNVTIGRGTQIMNYVEIRDNTHIGENCYIDSYVVFSGNCQIGHHVTLRYGVIIAKGCQVGDHSYLSPRVMTNNLDEGQNAVGGAKIGSHCFIGTHAVLQHGIIIEDNVVIGACSLVLSNCAANQSYMGTPARCKTSVQKGN